MNENEKRRLQKEAIKQLGLLGVQRDVLQELEKNFYVPVTYISGTMGKIGKVHQKALKAFGERNLKAFPFYIIESFLNGCELISIMYIEIDENTWSDDYEAIMDNCHYAFVYNMDYPEYSEIGEIGIDIVDDALYRIQ